MLSLHHPTPEHESHEWDLTLQRLFVLTRTNAANQVLPGCGMLVGFQVRYHHLVQPSKRIGFFSGLTWFDQACQISPEEPCLFQVEMDFPAQIGTHCLRCSTLPGMHRLETRDEGDGIQRCARTWHDYHKWTLLTQLVHMQWQEQDEGDDHHPIPKYSQSMEFRKSRC